VTGLLLLHAAATVSMAGLVWFVQVVHYPLLARVGSEAFVPYETEHVRRTTWVVTPLMLVEAGTAVLLVLLEPSVLTLVGIVLLVVVWSSTALVQVPLHRQLERGFATDAHRRLVRSNGVRTAAWTGRAAVALALLA
jgi:hypothetical protein